MKTVTKHFNDQPVKILVGDENNFCLFNIIDVAKILSLEIKQVLDDEETKKLISLIESSKTDNGVKKKGIIIESSEEIYINHMIIVSISFMVNVDFYLWSFDVQRQIIDLIINKDLKLTSKL